MKSETRKLILSSSLYTFGSLFGPMIFFGGIGWWLDSYFETRLIFVLIGVGIAFIVSNILLFMKAIKMSKKMKEYAEEVNK